MYFSCTLSWKELDGGERKRNQRKIKALGNLTPGRSVRDSEGHTKGLRPCRERPLQTGSQWRGWGRCQESPRTDELPDTLDQGENCSVLRSVEVLAV